MTNLAGVDAPAAQLSPRARLEILGAILLALFLFALDQTVVGMALPVIVTDLHVGDGPREGPIGRPLVRRVAEP
jgi:hypothetical protein